MSTSPWAAAIAAASLASMLVIGAIAARRTRSARDFFIAGQRVGLVVTGITTMSAAFSGFVFLGGPGLTFSLGIGSLFIVLPLGFTATMLCWTVGRRLRDLAAAGEVYTVPDALLARFGSRRVAGLGALAVAAGSIAYLGLQLRALGVLVGSVFDLGPGVALAIGAAVIVAYGAAGGMVAGVWTDLAQGVLMLVAAVAVFVLALSVAGGPAGIASAIAGADAFGRPFLEPLGRVPAATAFGFFFVFGVGVLGQPQMLHRFYMLRDTRHLGYLPLVLGGSQAACVLIWVGIGFAVPALVARGALVAPAHPDEATPAFLLAFAPDTVAGLAWAGALAAIMSTADSFANIGSAALVRDLPRALGRPLVNELPWGRAAIFGVVAAAALLAAFHGALIARLGTFAFGTFGAALAPAVVLGLAWPRVDARAAGASVATGLVLSVGLELAPPGLLQPGVLPAAVALAASFAVLVVATLATPDVPPNPGPPNVTP